MKRVLALTTAVIMGLTMLAGCERLEDSSNVQSDGDSQVVSDLADAGPEQEVDLDSLETIADARALETDETQYGSIDNTYIYAFKVGDHYYRVLAPIPKDVRKELDKLDVAQDDYQTEEEKLTSPLKIETREDLNDKKLSEEEMEDLIGKTGGQLLKDGWVSIGYDVDMMEFYYQYQCFEYTVVYDGTLEFNDDFDENEAVKPLKIKSVECTGFGDAIQLEE